MLNTGRSSAAPAWDQASADCLEWRASAPPTRWREVLRGVLWMWGCYAMLAIALLLLALLLVTPVVLLKGEDWGAIAAGWFAPELWWGGLWLALALALAPTPLLFAFRAVEAFRFDASRQTLLTLERRAWFQPVTRQWPFASITCIVPTLSNTTSALVVTLVEASGKSRQLRLAPDVSPTELASQALWLGRYFGDRLRPLEAYDGD